MGGTDRKMCRNGRQRHGRRAFGLAAIMLVLWAEPLLAQGVRSIGSVSELVGRCLVSRHGETEARPLALGAELYEGDSVRTAAGAKLKLEFIDGSVVQLGEGTELALDWFLYAPEAQTQNVLLQASAGIFRVIAELLLPRSAFVVQTATAAASVRGTEWIVEAAPGATAIVVLDGQVAVRNAAAAVPGEVVLQPGEGTTVEAGLAPRPPSVWGDARRNAFIARTAIP
jgi:hypothetical protein